MSRKGYLSAAYAYLHILFLRQSLCLHISFCDEISTLVFLWIFILTKPRRQTLLYHSHQQP